MLITHETNYEKLSVLILRTFGRDIPPNMYQHHTSMLQNIYDLLLLRDKKLHCY
jgi:hypothetical protein